MLRLMDIQPTPRRDHNGRHIFEVTLDRDGTVTRYDFMWSPPYGPGMPDFVNEPMDVVEDLLDYDTPTKPGGPCGAHLIKPIHATIQYVFKVAHGKALDFPIVLDER